MVSASEMFTVEFQAQLVPITDEIIAELVAAGWPDEKEIRQVIAELEKFGEEVLYSPATKSLTTRPVWMAG